PSGSVLPSNRDPGKFLKALKTGNSCYNVFREGRSEESPCEDPAMHTPVRVGAVNYLNTKPLICDLDVLAPGVELLLDVPSRLAALLAEGALDVALIPIIEYFRAGSYALVPNIAIASRGPVLSVTLFSRVPWSGIRRVALDEGSRTSAALAQILLGERHGV